MSSHELAAASRAERAGEIACPAAIEGHGHKSEVSQGMESSIEAGTNEWEQELATRPDLQKADSWQHFLAIKIERDTGMAVQWRNGLGDHLHMAKALQQANLVKRIQYYIAADCGSVYGVFDFGSELVSLPGVLHGGAQFMAFDETCGQLAFLVLPGGCVTVQTDIKFCKPFPAGRAKAVITAVVEKLEGRKAILKATLRDAPQGKVFSEVRMTYVKLPAKWQRPTSEQSRSKL